MDFRPDCVGCFTLNKPLSDDHYEEYDEFIIGYAAYQEDKKWGDCGWFITKDHQSIVWEPDDHAYVDYHVQWLEYVIERYFKHWGYTLNGKVKWRNRDFTDIGVTKVKNNVIEVISYKDVIINSEKYCRYIKYLEEHIKCSPDGELALEAKNDFLQLSSTAYTSSTVPSLGTPL